MSLHSQFTRIEDSIGQLILPDTLESSEKRALIYPVLEYEMPEYVSGFCRIEDVLLTFKASDGAAGNWRVLENASFADYLYPTNPAADCIVETWASALDFRDSQAAFIYVSRQFDSSGGAVCMWDLNVDADDEDLDSGEFLLKDLGLVLPWDELYPLDIYVTRKMSLRIKLAGNGKLYAVRARLGMLGEKADLSRNIQVVANFCVARYFDARVNRAINANAARDSIYQLRDRVAHFKKEALRLLGVDVGTGGRVVSGGGAGGVAGSSRPENRWRQKLTGRK